MKMKKLLTSILAVMLIITAATTMAACNEIEFKVNFIVDDVVYSSISTEGNEVIKMPENPTKDGYVFDGWYWDKDEWQKPFTANSLFDAPLSSDMSVHCKWRSNVISVESITLNKSNLSMKIGDEETLIASILPASATDASVEWTTSDPAIVSVTNGKVTALCEGNATVTVTTVDGARTATCEITVIEDKITFNTLTVEGENVYGIVSNSTTTFSFLKEIEECGNAEYNVYKEITCETPIASKTIALSTGDNTVYVLQTGSKAIKQYTVTIRRRPMYTVSFNSNGGTTVESQTIEESFCASMPTATRTGYTFDKWDHNFADPITKNTTITAIWKANENTAYKVEYYLQNLKNDEYTLTDTENKTGTTDTTATAEIKTFEHFTHKPTATDSGNISPDGSQVLKVYYTRDTYTVTFYANGGTLKSGNVTQTVKYGGSVVAPTYAKTGYTFDKWDKSLTNIDKTQTIKAEWKINQYTVTLVYDNGQPNTTITQDYDTEITVQDPTRDGYTFNGWDKELIVPADNVTITAKWSANVKLSSDGKAVMGLNNDAVTNLVILSEYNGVNVTSIGYKAFFSCSSLTSIYYTGTANEWEKISISFDSNSCLTNATMYYYSETEPTGAGNYWHYDTDGKTIVVWEKN